MANDIKKIMAKLNSQKSEKEVSEAGKLPDIPKKKKLVKKKVEEVEEDDDEIEEEEVEADDDDDDAEEPEEEETSEGQETQQTISSEIERLQNNGVFRAELLYQLIELNTNFKVLNALVMKALGGDSGSE